MNSRCALSLWRSLFSRERRHTRQRSWKQASTPAFPGKQFPEIIVTAFIILTSPALFTQTKDSATTATTIDGRVTDTAGAALIGASVTLGNLATGLERVVLTDANGNFAISAINQGNSGGARYRPIVSAVGFAPMSREIEFHAPESDSITSKRRDERRRI